MNYFENFKKAKTKRLADHATNIAEEVIYLIEGEIVRHEEFWKYRIVLKEFWNLSSEMVFLRTKDTDMVDSCQE